MADQINRTKPDIVHFNSLTLAPYLPVCGDCGVPAVLHVRERVHPGTLGLRKKWLKNIVLRNASAVIYICADNRDYLTGKHRIGSVVYNPVDFDKFDANIDKLIARRKVHMDEGGKMVLFLGGSGLEIKGIIPFLDSLRILKGRFTGFKCFMLGTYSPPGSLFLNKLKRSAANLFGIYSLRQQVERSIREYGLGEHVVSLPFKTNVEDYYAAADVVAVPFTAPHFARQVIEAGSMAKPVAASRIGGVEEVVRENETGILAEPGNPEAMAGAIYKLLSDPDNARKMGDSALEIARREYDMEISVRRVLDVYDTLLH